MSYGVKANKQKKFLKTLGFHNRFAVRRYKKLENQAVAEAIEGLLADGWVKQTPTQLSTIHGQECYMKGNALIHFEAEFKVQARIYKKTADGWWNEA